MEAKNERLIKTRHTGRLPTLPAATCWLLVMLLGPGTIQGGETVRPATKPRLEDLPLALRKMRWRVLGTRPLAMYYYYPDKLGLPSLEKFADQMTVLAPQCYWLDAEGFVHGEVPPKVLELAKRANVPIMPLLTNPGFDRTIARSVLNSRKAQERAVMYMGYLAKRDNYIGWQLDLEYIDPINSDLYVAFVERAAARLHHDGRLLGVAVVPRFSDSYPGTSPNGQFRTGEWGAPYHYRKLGRLADFITLMTYDQHNAKGPPGPVAGYAWVKAALDYAVERIPRQKLLLGIPFFGREWSQSDGKTTSRSLNFTDLGPLLARPEVRVQRHARWRSPWFQYREGSELRTVWFDDTRSFSEKLQLVRSYRLRGFAAWRLGSEDPEFWSQAAALAKDLVEDSPKKNRRIETGSPAAGQSKRPRGGKSQGR